MGASLPIIVVAIAGILVVLALVALLVWTKRKEGKPEQPLLKNKKAFFAPFVVGLMVALTGAFFMFDGDILGENTSGIATVMGIVGIGLIATSNVVWLVLRSKE